MEILYSGLAEFCLFFIQYTMYNYAKKTHIMIKSEMNFLIIFLQVRLTCSTGKLPIQVGQLLL